MVCRSSAGTAHTAMFLPGSGLTCVRDALRQRTIGLRSFCVFAEADTEVCELIRRKLKRIGFRRRPFLHRSLVETLNLDVVLQGSPLQYAFLDFCSPLNPSRLYWLRSVAGLLSNQATFAITVQRNRGGSFVSDCRRLLSRRKSRALRSYVRQTIPHCTPATIDSAAMLVLAFSGSRLLTVEDVREYRNDSGKLGGSWMTSLRFRVCRTTSRPPSDWRWVYDELDDLLLDRSGDWRLTEVCA